MRRALAILLITGSLESAAFAESPLELRLAEMSRALVVAFPESSTAKIAVTDFADLNGYQSALGKFVAEELTTQLAINGAGRITVIERRHLMSVLSEQKLSSTSLFDPESVEKIGRILGVQALVTGSITDLGAEMKVHARLLSVESGRVIGATSVSIPSDDTTRYLVSQVPGRPSGIASAGQAPPVQPASAYFENRFLRATVETVGVSEDRKSVTVALRLANLTDGDLYIALAENNSCEVMLVDDTGIEATASREEIGGLVCTHRYGADEETSYTMISGRSSTVVTLRFTRKFSMYADPKTISHEIKGRTAALSMDMFRFDGTGWSRFSIGVTNIALSR